METNTYTFIDNQDNIIEQVRADTYGQAVARLSQIAKTLLIDYSIEGA